MLLKFEITNKCSIHLVKLSASMHDEAPQIRRL